AARAAVNGDRRGPDKAERRRQAGAERAAAGASGIDDRGVVVGSAVDGEIVAAGEPLIDDLLDAARLAGVERCGAVWNSERVDQRKERGVGRVVDRRRI